MRAPGVSLLLVESGRARVAHRQEEGAYVARVTSNETSTCLVEIFAVFSLPLGVLGTGSRPRLFQTLGSW